MKNVEDQSLHCTFQLGMGRMSFDWPESSPYDVINGSWQILKVFNEELRGISSILGKWLHHTEHLTHIRFSLLKDALNSFTMKLTAMLLEISVIPADVKCGIELEQQLFTPMLLVSEEWQQPNFLEAIQSVFQTGQTSYCFNVKALVWEDATLVVKNA